MDEEEALTKKKRNRRRIAGIVIVVLLLLILLITLGRDIFVTRGQTYIPKLTLELDMSHLGQPPVVLLSLDLPPVRLPSAKPVSIGLPGKIEGVIPSDGTPFSPTIKPKVTFIPVFKKNLCKNLVAEPSAIVYQTITPPGSQTKPIDFRLVLPTAETLSIDAPQPEAECLKVVAPVKEKKSPVIKEETGAGVKKPFVTDTGFVCPVPISESDLAGPNLSPELLEELLKCLPADLCGNGTIDGGEECDPPGALVCPGLSACTVACTCGLVPPWREPPKELPPEERERTKVSLEPKRVISSEVKSELLTEIRETRRSVGQKFIEFVYGLFGITPPEPAVKVPISIEAVRRTIDLPERVVEFVEKTVIKTEVVEKKVEFVPEELSRELEAIRKQAEELRAPVAALKQCAISGTDANLDGFYELTSSCVQYRKCTIDLTGLSARNDVAYRSTIDNVDGKVSKVLKFPEGVAALKPELTCDGIKVAAAATISPFRAGTGGSTACAAGPTISTSSPLPDGTRGTAYSQTLAASGGQGSLTWSVSSGSLPSALSLNASTGVISGTPDTVASNSFTILVTDSCSSAQTNSKAFTLEIRSP